MEQTILVRGMGLFATLLGIQQWLVVEASLDDFFFIIFATTLLMVLEANISSNLPKESKSRTEEIGEKPFLAVFRGSFCNLLFPAIL